MELHIVTSISRDPDDASPASFDEAQALEALGSDRELLAIVARAFMEEGPKLLQRLHDAVARSDAQAVQSAGHALKGTVRYFGNTRVYELAHALETQGRSGNLNRAGEALEQLATCVPQLASELARCCQRAEHKWESSSG